MESKIESVDKVINVQRKINAGKVLSQASESIFLEEPSIVV